MIQLKKFGLFSKTRVKFEAHLNFLKNMKNILLVQKIISGIKTNFLAYPLIIKNSKKINRKKFQIFLERNNIQTRPIFSGNILRHPAFKNLVSKKNKLNSFPNSDYIMKNGLLIGCHQGLKTENIKFIHYKIKKFLTD